MTKTRLLDVDSAMLRTFVRLDRLEEEWGFFCDEIEEFVNGEDFDFFSFRFFENHGVLLQKVTTDYREMKKDWNIVIKGYYELETATWWDLVDQAMLFHYGK